MQKRLETGWTTSHLQNIIHRISFCLTVPTLSWKKTMTWSPNSSDCGDVTDVVTIILRSRPQDYPFCGNRMKSGVHRDDQTPCETEFIIPPRGGQLKLTSFRISITAGFGSPTRKLPKTPANWDPTLLHISSRAPRKSPGLRRIQDSPNACFVLACFSFQLP